MLNLINFRTFFLVLRVPHNAVDKLSFEILLWALEALLVVPKFRTKPVDNQLEMPDFFFLFFLDKLSASEAAGLSLSCLAS